MKEINISFHLISIKAHFRHWIKKKKVIAFFLISQFCLFSRNWVFTFSQFRLFFSELRNIYSQLRVIKSYKDKLTIAKKSELRDINFQYWLFSRSCDLCNRDFNTCNCEFISFSSDQNQNCEFISCRSEKKVRIAREKKQLWKVAINFFFIFIQWCKQASVCYFIEVK